MYEVIKDKIKELFASDFSGHDYFHTIRVYQNALHIAQAIPCDLDIVALTALLHDVDDAKLFQTVNYQNARMIMKEVNISDEIQEEVIDNISHLSFKGTGKSVPKSIEGKIVQDADRLDAIGAIGIARAFAYGGSHNRLLYDPNGHLQTYASEEEYHQSQSSTIEHFYEKLLLLKDLMNTEEAKRIATDRTTFMEHYLEQFYLEWDGKA